MNQILKPYTAGPWRTIPNDTFPLQVLGQEDSHPVEICSLGGPDAPLDAEANYGNARLIAAAPDLYEELHVLKETWDAGRTVTIEPGTVWAARVLEVLARVES